MGLKQRTLFLSFTLNMPFFHAFFAFFLSLSLLHGVVAFHGQATWYYDGVGACGGWNMNSDHIVALSQGQYYSNGGRCGKIIRVYYQGKSIDAQVVDLCPSCAQDAIDLSLSAFQALAPIKVGVIQVDWVYL